jgi:nucleoside phosphorylase
MDRTPTDITSGSSIKNPTHLARVIFLHFLDHDTIELFQLERLYSQQKLLTHLSALTRLGLLLSEEYADISAAALFEIPYAREIVKQFAPFREYGLLRISGNAFDPLEFQERKATYFSREPGKFPLYYLEDRNFIEGISSVWLTKTGSSTTDMLKAWRASLEVNGQLWRDIFEKHGLVFTRDIENRLYRTPDLITDTVFNVDTVVQMSRVPNIRAVSRDINCFITQEWMRSNARLLSCTFLTDLGYFDTQATLPPTAPTLSVARALKILHSLGIRRPLSECSSTSLLDLVLRPEWEPFRADLILRVSRRGPIWNRSEIQNIKSLRQWDFCSTKPLNKIDSFLRTISRYTAAITSADHHAISPNPLVLGEAISMPPSNIAKASADSIEHQPAIHFGIVTAIEVEREAVCRAFRLTDKHRIPRGARQYWRGRLRLKNNEFYEIVLTQLPDMANVDAALAANDMIHHWKPSALLMLGIAAAATKQQALGDVVVGSDVYYVERGKTTPKGTTPEPKVYRADATLWNRVITLPKWKTHIPVPRPDNRKDRPVIHLGVIASGERVIADKAVRDEIAVRHRKMVAIEMEGYGVSAAAWQSFDRVRHLVIRTICDLGDSRKTDRWHPYAAAVVAGFAKHFLLDRPLEPSNPYHTKGTPKKD